MMTKYEALTLSAIMFPTKYNASRKSVEQIAISTNGSDRLLLSTEFEARGNDGSFPLP